MNRFFLSIFQHFGMPALLVGFIAVGCSFGKFQDLQKSPLSKDSAGENKAYDELDLDLNSTAPLSSSQPNPKGGLSPQPAKRRPQVSSVNRPNCEKIASRIPLAYQSLIARKHASIKIPEHSIINKIAAITPDQCSDPSRSGEVLRLLIEAVSNFTPKIVILLPLTGPMAGQGKAVYDGIRSRLGMTGLRPEQVIFRDTAGKDSFSEHWIAEAVFVHQAAMIIGGLTNSEEALLRNYANQLYLPTLILAPPKRQSTLSSPYVFNVFPSETAMNEALISKAVVRNIRRVGILLPSGRGDTDLVQSFIEVAKQKSVQIIGPFTYEPGNYDSMERAASQIFKTNKDQRGREYQDALKKARVKATAEGQGFDPRFVILKPVIDVEAVFVPDNFRTIRFFAKIFKYLGVERMTLLGNQEWRATPLIQPYEPYLEGSLFADYIGYYNELPMPFRPFAGDNKKFLQGSYAGTFDFKSIGLQAFMIASNALRIPTQRRYQLVSTLRQLGSGPDDITKYPSIFDRFNRFNWPAYVFEVANRDIQLRR